jgi:hypothetical protein
MIRNILEWAKEMVDARIESYSKEKPIRKDKPGTFRETRQEDLTLSKLG